jgi:hypothetical protein
VQHGQRVAGSQVQPLYPHIVAGRFAAARDVAEHAGRLGPGTARPDVAERPDQAVEFVAGGQVRDPDLQIDDVLGGQAGTAVEPMWSKVQSGSGAAWRSCAISRLAMSGHLGS